MRAGTRDGLLIGMDEFFALPPRVAVAVLGVYDAVLKPMFHNALTGKISDFAGCFFFPLYVSALLSLFGAAPREQRLLVGAAFTVLLFAPVKLSAAAGAALCALLLPIAQLLGISSLRIVADPTDLWALLMVPLAVAFGRRAGRQWKWSPA
jgi:hypothetical protein